MFLSAKNSQIEVVQSVGRVMRKAPGKKFGYIIIPVIVPSFVKPEEVLDDHERFRVVWMVLNALKAHDDRFDALITKIKLNDVKPDGGGSILIGGIASGPDFEGEGDSAPAGAPAIRQGDLLPGFHEYGELYKSIYPSPSLQDNRAGRNF